MSQSEIAGVPLNWIETEPRRGGTVVLLHPVGLDLTYWDHHIDALRTKYRVVALDAPGHGRSGGGPEDCSFARMVEVIAGFIEQARGSAGGPVCLVGVSWGGMLAQALVLARPDLVSRLVLMGTACTFPAAVRESMRARANAAREQGMAALLESSLARWFTPATKAARPHVIDRVSKTVLADDPLMHAAIWEAIQTFDVEARLGEIKCPTLIVVGELDQSTPPAAAEVMRAGIAGARLQVLPGAAHFLHLEAAEAVSAALLLFLEDS